MSKVMPFSRVFPCYHPQKAMPTYFVEKLWASFYNSPLTTQAFLAMEERLYNLNKHLPYCIFQEFRDEVLKNRSIDQELIWPKYHTIRSGHRYKPGDMFSPRVWSGRPYCSKQLIIFDDMEVKKTWDFEMDAEGVFSLNKKYWDVTSSIQDGKTIAENDGLNSDQFLNWFPANGKRFDGQVICWNDKIEY